jgi:hypothetical protein
MIKRLRAAILAATLAVTGAITVAGAPAQAAPEPVSSTIAPPTIANNPTTASRAAVRKVTPGKKADGSVVVDAPLPRGPLDSKTVTSNKVLTPCVSCYHYTEEQQGLPGAPATQVSFDLNYAAKPFLARAVNNTIQQEDSHTLSQIALKDSTTNNTLEVGVTEDPNLNTGNANRDNSALFIGSYYQGSFQGYNGGNGWANSGNCAADGVCPGNDVAALAGTARPFIWEYFNDGPGGVSDGWWVGFNNKWMGLFDDGNALWTNTFQSADSVQLFGELAGIPGTSVEESCSDLGNGDFGSATTGAGFSNYTTNSATAENLVVGTVTDATKWNTFGTGTGFKFGGPGWNSIGEATGVKDHCAPNAGGTPGAGFQLWKESCPDRSVTTGCNAGQLFTNSLGLNVCTPIAGAGTTEVNGVKNNLAGHSFRVWRYTNCVGTSRLYASGAGEAYNVPSGWSRTNIKAVTKVS